MDTTVVLSLCFSYFCLNLNSLKSLFSKSNIIFDNKKKGGQSSVEDNLQLMFEFCCCCCCSYLRSYNELKPVNVKENFQYEGMNTFSLNNEQSLESNLFT